MRVEGDGLALVGLQGFVLQLLEVDLVPDAKALVPQLGRRRRRRGEVVARADTQLEELLRR
jgi:hypothetical protein